MALSYVHVERSLPQVVRVVVMCCFCLFSHIAVVVAAVVEVFHVSLAKRAKVVVAATVAVVVASAVVIYHACVVAAAAAAVTHKPYITDITAHRHTHTAGHTLRYQR